MVDSAGNKALAHMDTEMDHETPLDDTLFSFATKLKIKQLEKNII